MEIPWNYCRANKENIFHFIFWCIIHLLNIFFIPWPSRLCSARHFSNAFQKGFIIHDFLDFVRGCSPQSSFVCFLFFKYYDILLILISLVLLYDAVFLVQVKEGENYVYVHMCIFYTHVYVSLTIYVGLVRH